MNDFRTRAAQLDEHLVTWRRDFHSHPEIAFQEQRTAGKAADELRALGLEVQTEVGRTGVVAILEGAHDGPTVLVRCDMDALPMTEENTVPYASTDPAAMHACGHDGHTAIGLAVAHILTDLRDNIHGRVKFVFQPAEETAEGARAMIKDGVLDAPVPAVALGLHLWNSMPVGQVAVTPGPAMAGADTFDIVIRGKGGHGASPHETRDPLLAAAQVVTALQSVVSRNVDPLDTAVLSVTSFHAGTAANIIPPEAHLRGTIRSYTDSVHDLVIKRLHELTEGITRAMGCEAEVKTVQVTPPLVNDLQVSQVVSQAIMPYVKLQPILTDVRTMGAEDMAIFLQHTPGCFIFVGSGNSDRGLDFPHHHPRFDFDEAALSIGATLLTAAVAAYVIPE